MGGRQNHKRKKKKNHESPGLVAMSVPIEPQADRLSRGDSYTLLGLLLGVLFVLVVPPFWLKVPGLMLVCVSCIGFARKSHWTHQWRRSKQLWTAISAIIVVCLVSIPQLASQWKSEHPVPTQISSSMPIPLSSTPAKLPPRIPVKVRSKKITEKPLVIPSPTPVPLTADELADKVAKRLADQRPVSTPTPIPTPTPKPLCRGDNLSICTDEDLLEWGKPLVKEVGRFYGYYEDERGKAAEHHSIKAFEEAENTLADRFRNCCAEDAAKYYREISSRVGGGARQSDFLEWENKLMKPIGSHEWKAARQDASRMVLNIRYELDLRMIDLESAIRLANLKKSRHQSF